MSMTQIEEKNFVEGAFQALIDRGVASKSMLTPSTVTDAEIDRFEETFDVKLPSIFRTHLKAYCYDFTVICAPIPVDGMKYDELGSEKGLCWIELLSLPKENPLKNLYALMECFRSVATHKELVNMSLDQVRQFVPIGEWDGPFCMDTSCAEADAGKADTWQLCQFDQTVFDWEAAGYMDDHGVVKGEKIMPDFKTLLELYFYGKYDREYEQQLRARGEEQPDYGYYIHQQQKRPA